MLEFVKCSERGAGDWQRDSAWHHLEIAVIHGQSIECKRIAGSSVVIGGEPGARPGVGGRGRHGIGDIGHLPGCVRAEEGLKKGPSRLRDVAHVVFGYQRIRLDRRQPRHEQ